MLARLARYLRAAGYDTELASDGAADRHWIEQARREGRLLLTCDRQLLLHKAADGVVLHLQQGRLDQQAAVLRERCGVDWLWHPFSRCLMDNTPLRPASPASLMRLPECVRDREARECPHCARIYWAGSHHRRMHNRLAHWRGLATAGGAGHAG